MDNRKKDLLLHLYGEHPDEGELRALLKDEDLRSEYHALSEVKFRLDHRPRVRPDAHIVDHLLAASGSLKAGDLSRADRGPVQRYRSLRRVLLPAVSLAAAIVLGIGIGWFANGSRSEEPVLVQPNTYSSIVQPESLFRSVPPGPGTLSQTGTTDPLLAWDEADRVRNIHRRIESLQRGTSGLEWGEPTLPLESLPSGRTPGIRTAGSNN